MPNFFFYVGPFQLVPSSPLTLEICSFLTLIVLFQVSGLLGHTNSCQIKYKWSELTYIS